MMLTPAAILVDWGTSNLRLWAVGDDGSILCEHKSSSGMRTLAKSEFKTTLNEALGYLGCNKTDVPVVMCGMVGSRQGWTEAPYKNLPVSFDAIIGAARRIDDVQERDTQILPGIARLDDVLPDVMRSEETQLLGLQALGKFEEAAGEMLVCMPGSHAKWALVGEGQIKHFHTAMTGELIAACMSETVLRHSFRSATVMPKIDSEHEVFLAAVDNALANPSGVLNALFATRSRDLLGNAGSTESAAWLSGSVIGHDVAAALDRCGRGKSTILVGGGKQGPLYQVAMRRAGLEPVNVDADEASVAGLRKAACTMWPSRFEKTLNAAMELSIG